MAKIDINFNNTNYTIDEASLSTASAALRNHLSTVMNGTGAKITIGGTTYNVDATKLATATNAFVAHLGTINGGSNAIVWDGNTAGLETFYHTEIATNFIRIHDYVDIISVDDIDSVVFIAMVDGEKYEQVMPDTAIGFEKMDGGWGILGSQMPCSNGSLILGGSTFPEGLWVPEVIASDMAGITINLTNSSASGSTLTVNGVEYPIDFSKLSGAVADLETVLGGLNSSVAPL